MHKYSFEADIEKKIVGEIVEISLYICDYSAFLCEILVSIQNAYEDM